MEFVVDHGIKFVNLCPKHDIVILLEDGEKLVVPPSGIVARCTSSEVVVRTMGRVQGKTMEFGEVYDLPAPEENTIYIASRLVADRVKRADVTAPGKQILFENGSRACEGLSVFA